MSFGLKNRKQKTINQKPIKKPPALREANLFDGFSEEILLLVFHILDMATKSGFHWYGTKYQALRISVAMRNFDYIMGNLLSKQKPPINPENPGNHGSDDYKSGLTDRFGFGNQGYRIRDPGKVSGVSTREHITPITNQA